MYMVSSVSIYQLKKTYSLEKFIVDLSHQVWFSCLFVNSLFPNRNSIQINNYSEWNYIFQIILFFFELYIINFFVKNHGLQRYTNSQNSLGGNPELTNCSKASGTQASTNFQQGSNNQKTGLHIFSTMWAICKNIYA